LTLCAVATLIIGVSVPAAAIAGPNSVYATPPATSDKRVDTQNVDTQNFTSAYAADAAPVVRDAFGVETIVQAPTVSFSSITGTLVQWPANTTAVNDGFGYRGDEFHGGIDIMAAGGSTIMAASPGTVVAVAEDDGWGAYVKVDHGGGIYTLYAHMISGSQTVSVGQFVGAGESLGLVGQTGYASVPHLHFEVYAGGSRVDPMGWLP
jgi:murein DD-endopeptidase MepM/ murein hydrolase activator NlpD